MKVNQAIEVADPFPFEPGSVFTYEALVVSDRLVGNQLVKLASDQVRFRHSRLSLIATKEILNQHRDFSFLLLDEF